MGVSKSPGPLARLWRLVTSGLGRLSAYACRGTAKVQQTCPILLVPLKVRLTTFLIFFIPICNSGVLALLLAVFLVRSALPMARSATVAASRGPSQLRRE